MKRIILLTIIIIALFNTGVMASETTGDTTIPEMKWEELIQTLQARSAKVDIIKKNNKEITIKIIFLSILSLPSYYLFFI